MEAKQLSSSRIEDIIFENRNKAYGAYDIRQKYNRNVGIATAVAISLLLLFLISPIIISLLTPPPVVEAPPKEIRSIAELEDVKPLDETKPPPPPIVPPQVKIIKFVPPVITEEIVEADPPTVEEIKTTTTGAVEQEGEEDVAYTPPVVTEIEKPVEDNTIYEFADELPKFKGGDLDAYLRDNIKYPALAAENDVQGTVYLDLTVGKDGSIQDVKIKKDIGSGCGKEAERVVRNMPKWEPGKQNGRDVSVKMTIRVKFVLSN